MSLRDGAWEVGQRGGERGAEGGIESTSKGRMAGHAWNGTKVMVHLIHKGHDEEATKQNVTIVNPSARDATFSFCVTCTTLHVCIRMNWENVLARMALLRGYNSNILIRPGSVVTMMSLPAVEKHCQS